MKYRFRIVCACLAFAAALPTNSDARPASHETRNGSRAKEHMERFDGPDSQILVTPIRTQQLQQVSPEDRQQIHHAVEEFWRSHFSRPSKLAK